jgi:hypothetical protein
MLPYAFSATIGNLGPMMDMDNGMRIWTLKKIA